MTAELHYDLTDHVATITLDRPDSRNAFTEEMVVALGEFLDRAEDDDDVRVVIVTGHGPAFSAGGDLNAMLDKSGMFAGEPAELRDNYRRNLQKNTRRFDVFEKPVIAAVNGHAVGAGLGLALMADIRICSRKAKLGASFARVGLIPGDGSAWLLSRTVGFARAAELVLTSRLIDAEEAHRIGLVNEVVDADAVQDRAREVAAEIAALPPTAVRLAKVHLYRTWQADLENALHMAASLQSAAQSSEEHLDAVRAMLEKLGK